MYGKGTKLLKRYEVTKKVRSYEKGTRLRKRYEVTKKVRSCIHRWRHCKHDVTTLHETFSAKLLRHDVISLECEIKHTNLTLVNERQNNVTIHEMYSPYSISTFIPLDVDKFGPVCFLLVFNFLSAERFFQIRVTGLKFNKRFFSSTVNISFVKDGYLWPKVTWPQLRLVCFISHSNDMTSWRSNLAENVSCNVVTSCLQWRHRWMRFTQSL
jgi:hypothetical protein